MFPKVVFLSQPTQKTVLCQVLSNSDLKINTLYKTYTGETLDLKPHVKVYKMHTVKLYLKKEDFTITVL